jgi:hypothetical protein
MGDCSRGERVYEGGSQARTCLNCARKARTKVDLPTLAAPTMYTARPLRSRSTAASAWSIPAPVRELTCIVCAS